MKRNPFAVAACLFVSAAVALGATGCVGSVPPPAVDPSQPKCYGSPVWLGYKCCDDGYPGECPEDELCYVPDECRAAPGPNDEARLPHKRRF